MTTIFRPIALAALAMPTAAHADVFQDLDQVDAVAAGMVAPNGVAVRPADRRLKLAPCPQPLVGEPQSQGAVAVYCPVLGWRIRLPVEGVVRADGVAPVIIRRGDPVTVDYVAQGFSLSAAGVAERDARRGEAVEVRIDQKSRPVMGKAVAVGTVRIDGLKE